MRGMICISGLSIIVTGTCLAGKTLAKLTSLTKPKSTGLDPV